MLKIMGAELLEFKNGSISMGYIACGARLPVTRHLAVVIGQVYPGIYTIFSLTSITYYTLCLVGVYLLATNDPDHMDIGISRACHPKLSFVL